ncbi:hypothetical protein RI367_003413 [Sorochytrium milnesiophthora]
MSEKTALSPAQPEYAALEYFLQLSLHASTAHLVAAYALSNPHTHLAFEKRCSTILCLDAFVDSAALPAGNSEDEVMRRGFAFGQQCPGLKVNIGDLELSSASQAGDHTTPAKANLFKVVLCKVGIGRAYIRREEDAARELPPDGYDSFYLADCDTGAGYSHSYYIHNAAQILPMFVLHFEYDPVKERRSREKAKCDMCEVAVAEFYCAADAANLCKACDLQVHSANKLMSRHIRTPIGRGTDVFGMCRHHPEKSVEFFCSVCNVPVCVYCKMVGNHSSGDAAKHKLVGVTEAYQSVVAEAQSVDSILQSRRQNISQQLGCIASRFKSVEKHAAGVQQQIDEIYRKALLDLRHITKRKVRVLDCATAEIDRLEEFLRYQQEGDATHFLFSWARHQQLRAQLHDFKFFRDKIDVTCDIKCTGSINVMVENALPSTSPARPSKSAASVPNSPAGQSVTAPKRYGGNSSATLSRPSDDAIDQASALGRRTPARSEESATSSSPSHRSAVGGMVSNSDGPQSPRKQAGSGGGLGLGGATSNANGPSANTTTAGSPARGRNSSPGRTRKLTTDFFNDALGVFDQLSQRHPGESAGGTTADFNLADGEGYLSD